MGQTSRQIGRQQQKRDNLARGTVNGTTVGRLLAQLLHTNSSGIVRFAGQRRKMSVIVKGVNLLEIQSNYIREDTLGLYLIGEKAITPQENEASLKKAREAQLPQGQILVGMHLMTQNELLIQVTRHKTRKFLRLFSGAWDGCEYEFQPQQVAVRKSLMDPVAIAKVLKVGILKIARFEEIYRSIDQRNLFNKTLLPAPDFNHVAGLLDMKETTLEKARWIVGKSLQEIRNLDSGNFERVLRLAYLLVLAQAARFDSKPKETMGVIDKIPESPHGSSMEPKLKQALSDAKNFFEDQDYRIAKAFLDRALRIDEKNPDALAMMAWADYQLQGKQNPQIAADCIELCKKAVRFDPENESAHLYLGKIYKDQNHPDLAAPHFLRAGQINPDNEETQREVRLIRIQKRKRDEFKYHG